MKLFSWGQSYSYTLSSFSFFSFILFYQWGLVGLGLATGGIGAIVGALWKRHAIITIIKYSDDTSEPQIMVLDFEGNTKYAQPILDRRMRKARNLPDYDDNKSTISIADELTKLVKLKEQGAITEEEFSQMKSNLMKNM